MERPVETEPSVPRRGIGAIRARPVTAALLLVVALSALFLAFPAIDLRASGLFYAPGKGFDLSKAEALRFFRRTGDLAVATVVVVLLASVAVKLARPGRPSPIAPRTVVFLLTTLALGPGLLVNVVLKDHWGRPRPVMVDTFGGAFPYVEVWRISGYCARNCSFVAGEASSAVWLTALALVVPAGWRLPVAIGTGTYALLLSLNRIAFGGHFLSDVLISWALTWLVMALVWRVVVADPPRWLANDRLEAGLAAMGRRLRGGGPSA
ncbi:MAG TPA: phosphatase PAP2 family protein [Bauldia sp.]|nr:phosphatase PAP2 family protein [Bauldia sp.]